MAELRLIKRYPNRRLYDTTASHYVTLNDIKDFVTKNIAFKVIDNKTNDDITAYILLQIIVENENKQFPLFTTEILKNMIRFYGNPLQKNMTQYLEKFFSQFVNQDHASSSNVKDSMELFTQLAQQNIALWQSTFSKLFNQTNKNKK